MWTTKQVISMIRDYMPEVSEIRAREYLTRAYLTLVNTDTNQTIFMLNTGDIPFPTLVLGTSKEYILNATNLLDSLGNPIDLTVNGIPVTVRKVKSVFEKGQNGSPYAPYGYEYGANTEVFCTVPVQSVSQMGNTPAKITFTGDLPTNECYIEFWYAPRPLETPFVEMVIDTTLWLDALIDGAVGFYEDQANGNSVRKEKFLREHLKNYKQASTESLRLKIPESFPRRALG